MNAASGPCALWTAPPRKDKSLGWLRIQVKRLLEVASNHGAALRDAADQLHYLWGELEEAKAPAYDVPTAVHVLETGGWRADM